MMSDALKSLQQNHPDRYQAFLEYCDETSKDLLQLNDFQVDAVLGFWLQAQPWYGEPVRKMELANSSFSKNYAAYKNALHELQKMAGALLGLAIGDALGAPLEFRSRCRFTPISDMTVGGKFEMRLGEWTDDTAMALCLADSLIECNGFDAQDQMDRYIRWGNEGYNSTRSHAFGVGKTVAKALMNYQRSGDPYSGSKVPESAGNGSLMRIAPIAIFYAHDRDDSLKYAVLSSKTTHAAEECVQACTYFVDILINAFGCNDKEKVLTPSFSTELFSERLKEVVEQKCFSAKSADEIVGSGYVVESLEAALWAFWHHDSFEQVVLAAANLGDDSDTTAAIAGQLAGAFYGTDNIPAHWRKRLMRSDHIYDVAWNLSQHTG